MNREDNKNIENFLEKFTTVKPDEILRDRILLNSKNTWETGKPSIITFLYKIAAAFVFMAIALSIITTSMEDRKMLLFFESNSEDSLKLSGEYLNLLEDSGIDRIRILIVSSLKIKNKTDSYSVEGFETYKNKLNNLIKENVKS